MKLKDFDFRLALTAEVMADIVCDNKGCPCQTPLLYGEQARNHFNDPLYKDCEVELWSEFYDSKMVKIYENDIVLYNGTMFLVVYKGGAFLLVEAENLSCGNVKFLDDGAKCEVIGNKHENQELLKVDLG